MTKILPTLSHFSRAAGILLHPTSLPTLFGIGDLGSCSRTFVENLSRANQHFWQMLPLTPTNDSNSPYQSFSAFAGNVLLISPDDLYADNLLRKDDLLPLKSPKNHIDFLAGRQHKMKILHASWTHFSSQAAHPLATVYEEFVKKEKHWLDDFTLFIALRESHQKRSWTDWPTPLRTRNAVALKTARKTFAEEIRFHAYLQFLFFRQLDALRDHAHANHAGLIGDIPIFVAHDSADVWAHPAQFKLFKNGLPQVIAGVPPDFFSTTGQLWGNPHYDWPAMKRTGYLWWIERLQSMLRTFDLIRIDHFRGFAAAWEVPANAPNAKPGKWIRGPADDFFHAVAKAFPAMPFIAEDLGVITPDVELLRDTFALPGMRILQFGFNDDPANPHSPHNFVNNSIAYTGTHDNDTTRGWYSKLTTKQRRQLATFLPHISRSPSKTLLESTWSSTAKLAIAPLQDLLDLPSTARMNTPGVASNNWNWRLDPHLLKPTHWRYLTEITKRYNRAASPH